MYITVHLVGYNSVYTVLSIFIYVLVFASKNPWNLWTEIWAVQGHPRSSIFVPHMFDTC